MSSHQPVVVGAGPAGVRAAQTLVRGGLRPIVIDEAARAGGQIYRRQPEGFRRPARMLYGFDTARAERVHRDFDDLLDLIDHRPQTLAWNARQGELDLLHMPSGTVERLPFGHLILATGATDRILPLPGWTLPGAYSLGAAQIALKFQGCTIGRRTAFMGTGPLLYLVAYQYMRAGAEVAAVIDTAGLADQSLALPALAARPAMLARGLYYVARLRAAGVPIHRGARPLRIHGEQRVTGLSLRQPSGESIDIDCDAVGLGHALRSETQLADLLGCRFAPVAVQRAHLPWRDADGRSSVPGVYLAGDGAGIMGADAAEWAGELAALALLADRAAGAPAQSSSQRMAELRRKLARAAAFRAGLERAFPVPEDWACELPDETVVCRCENVTAGEIRITARQEGTDELNRLKALCRVGMGRCQGRMCGAAAAELLAHERGVRWSQVGRLRGQAPVKPVPMMVAAESPAGVDPTVAVGSTVAVDSTLAVDSRLAVAPVLADEPMAAAARATSARRTEAP